MPIAKVAATIDGTHTEQLSLGYEIIGDRGRPWVITPGGRFNRNYPGVRELATELADRGNRVLIYDRPNTGESDVCFTGSTESAMQADALAALVEHLDLAPAVIAGGSGGSRVSLLTAARHPEVCAGLAVWWISGGAFGLLTIGLGYCAESIRAVWNGGMEAVAALPETTPGNWQEVLARNPANREKLLSQDPAEFKATMERWLLAHCPCGDDLVPGLRGDTARQMTLPTLVFRSGTSDPFHTREASEAVAGLLPNADLVEPPWSDTEWVTSAIGQRFVNWPRLAPQLHEWAGKTLAAAPPLRSA
jgi:pimeloyl-ACP methyl ester carboxylesterase